MKSPNSHAAVLQLIAEDIRSPAAGQLTSAQRDRLAGMLDRIAVDLLVPTNEEVANALTLQGDWKAEISRAMAGEARGRHLDS